MGLLLAFSKITLMLKGKNVFWRSCAQSGGEDGISDTVSIISQYREPIGASIRMNSRPYGSINRLEINFNLSHISLNQDEKTQTKKSKFKRNRNI